MFYKGNSQQIQRLMRMGAGCAYDVLSQVVFRIKPSVRAAYRDQEDKVGASLISLYNKLNGVETHTSAALVRYSASVLTPLIEQLDGARVSWLPGYRVKIIDGNCLEASERRLKALREVQAEIGRAHV